MKDILVIDLDEIYDTFEEIKLSNIIHLLAECEEGNTWMLSTREDLEDNLIDQFNLIPSETGNIAILDLETNEFSKIEVEITVGQTAVEETKIEMKRVEK